MKPVRYQAPQTGRFPAGQVNLSNCRRVSAREERRVKAEADKQTTQNQWVIRIQEIMLAKECSAVAALGHLEREVAATPIPPQRRGQFQACWLEFKRRCRNAADIRV